MLAVFRALIARVKGLLLSDALLDLEALTLARAARRKAGLLRRAAAYEAEGLAGVAADLRRQAEMLDLARPAATVWPGLVALTEEGEAFPRLKGTTTDGANNTSTPRLPESNRGRTGVRQSRSRGS